MSLYEGMFILDNRQANRDWDGTLEKLKGLLAKHGAEILRCDKWGERKLAYEMDGRRRGTYVLVFFNATGVAVTEIYRECELAEMILRALILKVPAIPPEDQLRPSDEYPARRGEPFASPAREAAPAGAEPAETSETPEKPG